MKNWMKWNNLTKSMCRLRDDEDGAALVEYTVLLAIMLILGLATIILVGTWISGKWTALYNNLQGN